MDIRHICSAFFLLSSLFLACKQDEIKPTSQIDSYAGPPSQGEEQKEPREPANGLFIPVNTEEHAFTVDDLLAMDKINEPQLSPDGSQIVFVRKKVDLKANRSRSDLWLLERTTGILKQLTEHPENDRQPQWTKNGQSIYYISDQGEQSQIWYRSLRDDQAIQVRQLPVAVDNLRLSPDGEHLLFTAELFPDCDTLECTKTRLDAKEKQNFSGQLYDQLFVRHWDFWKDGRISQLLVLDLDSDKSTPPRNLSRALAANVPSKPFGGREEFQFTPDSKSVVFTAREQNPVEAWSTNFDLFVVPIDGSAPPRKLTENPAWDSHPVFSPDGKQLAYLAMKRPGYEADRFRIMVQSWPEGTPRVLAENWDRSVQDLAFTADGKSLLVTAQDNGHMPLFSISLASEEVHKLVDQGTVSAFLPAQDQVIFLRDSFTSPSEFWSISLTGQNEKSLSQIHAARLASVRMGEPERFYFEGWNGERVYGWAIKPSEFSPQKRYPLALLIHGGPQGSFANNFHYRWNPQVYAGAGYAVVMIDFHGSTGYGQDFTDSIAGDWGGKPLIDLEKGLQAAFKQFSWIDDKRVCALGASYGGYMINWIAGVWPEPFRCLVNHDGIFDQRSMYYSTEELWFPEWEHGGPYFAKPSVYEKHNPVQWVEKWNTPMFVIHGALDYRVPVEQGLATFTALQRRGIDSQFLYFPDENHWVLKPGNTRQWHQEVLKWLDRHLKTSP